MLSNNADARRCSYFELGLPVVSFTPFFAKIAKKIASKCLRVKCNPGHKWIECSENVCTRYRTTLANASWSLFYRAFRKNYAIWLKGPMLEDSLQWIGFVEFSTTRWDSSFRLVFPCDWLPDFSCSHLFEPSRTFWTPGTGCVNVVTSTVTLLFVLFGAPPAPSI